MITSHRKFVENPSLDSTTMAAPVALSDANLAWLAAAAVSERKAKRRSLRNGLLAVSALAIGAFAPSMAEAATLTYADFYTAAALDVTSPTTLYSSLNFPSYLDGPLTGSSTLTTTGYFGSLLYLTNNGASNTFSGNITVDSGTLRLTASPFGTTTGGFTAPSMTSSNTITLNRAGTLFIDDNVTNGYTANRFGTASRPAVNLAGGTLNLNGLNNASSSVQTFGALTSSSGQGTVNVTRNTSGNPTLTFSSLAINSGSLLTFNGTALGTGTNDARITFTTTPTLTNGIIAGARFATSSSDTATTWVTYDTNGVRALTASDFTDVATDINAVATTANVRITSTTLAPVALSADTTINSLIVNGGTWNMTKKLTLTSGMFARGGGSNNALDITSGTLTAGTGSAAIDLHIINGQQDVTFSGTSVIADNGVSGVVTLVKGGDTRKVTLNGADNTYTGGTYVVGGVLSTGTTANRTYLGTGKVTVDGNSTLTLGNVGATSNATGDDYTAINGGLITLASAAAGVYTAADTFNIGANSIIQGASTTNQSLNSLTRGTNITLASGAIIAHSTALTAALNLTTGTIKSLGTSADLFYGLAADQNNTGGSIDIGSGTAFRGISTDRSARNWLLGTINIASGTTSVDFQGFAAPGVNPVLLTLGNGATANAPVINFAGTGTVDIRALGALTVNDGTASYGNTGASQNVRFVSTAGSTLTFTAATTGMGSGTGIASALVQNGGILAIGAADSLNGAVTVQAGGKLNANQAGGLTGGGALTFNAGSIIDITNATGFSGSQASAASLAAGTIIRLNNVTYGTAGTTLDSIVGGGSPIYQIAGGNSTPVNPTSPSTTIMTLNKNGSGVGGILTNDLITRSPGATANGVITLGANGGVIAATTNTVLAVAEDITGAGSLTINSTSAIDGAPKAGTVTLSNTANNYMGGTIVNGGALTYATDNILGDAAGSITLNGGTIKPGNTMTTARELILNNVAGNAVQIQGNQTWTTTGNITGDGGVTFRQNPNGGVTADLRGTANTFKGALGIQFVNSGIIVKLRSLTDSVAANGNIIYGIGSTANTGGAGQIFEWDSAAGSALILDNRSIEFGQNGSAWGTVKNSHATNAVTINTNLVVSGTGTKTFVLESVDGPRNAFNGNITDGSGTIVLRKEGAGDWVLGGANSYTGGTSITAGGLTFLNTGAKSSSGTHAFSAVAMLGLGVSGPSGFTATDILNAFTGTMTGNLTGITVTTTTNVGVDTTNGDFTLASNIASTAKQLHKLGSNTLTLTGTNANTGLAIAKQGTLQYGTTTSLSSSLASRLAARSGATLAFNVGGTNEFTTGNVTTLLTNLAASSSTTNGMNAGSSLGFDTTNASGGSFTIANIVADTTGASGGARGLSKLGTGSLVLTNTSTYTGATTVNGGRLLVNGSIASGSAVTVNSTATLGGNGTVNGAVTVAAGGTLRAGDGSAAADDLALDGNLTLSDGSYIELVLGDSGTHSTLARTGSGTWAFDSDQAFKVINAVHPLGAQAYDNVITNLTGMEAGLASIATWNIITPQWTGTFSFDGANVDLNVTATPEPTSLTLLGLGGMGLLKRRRRR